MVRSTSYNGILVLLHLIFVIPLSAQGSRALPTETRNLDVKADRAQQEYLNSLFELSKNYEDIGAIDKSKQMLNAILTVMPDAEAVKKKLEEYDNAVFEDQVRTFDLDTSLGWTQSGIRVTKGKPIRIEATGSYKFIVNADLGPEGYDSNSAARDLVHGVPTGALMAVIAPIPSPKGGKKKSPELEPFLIGERKEFVPEESGTLLLKVNTPPLAKCIGKLKIKLSGNISR
ncbi:hypothetical protein KOR42_17520 [Thalassoglobus neptunius]|uniref:Uncharacterized protein n=1 Tax=Thalassoglobus neptunius TaxID=1938619 RepID=A0A5C5X6H6_9PLAN|nr:hypothetical protein [Thalassoglobus neptunius]TWT58378.1 hypothetical protein KOR42_17520 [Thalassoglobus neptunius]